MSWARLVGVASLALAAISCGHPGAGGSPDGGCTAGTERCPCLAGNTCMAGLSCATDLNECVQASTAGTSGTAGTNGTAGSSGTAGVSGAGGMVSGAGGALSGVAGSSGPGNAGTNGSGTAGSAGINGTAGSAGPGTAGSNGTAGTNGNLGGNLITNGDFSMGQTDWGISTGTPSNPGVKNGAFCLTLSSTNGNVVLGWGSTSTSVSLDTGVSYTLSYQASTSSALSTFQVHVGQVVSPYNVDYPANNDTPGAGLTTFTHNFTLTTADPQAGVAFVVATSAGSPTVCVDNVSLTAGN
jgi:hypothetical protein